MSAATARIRSLGSTDAMVADAVAPGTANVTYEPVWDEAAPTVARIARPGDLVITVGCGDVTKVAPKIVDEIQRLAAELTPDDGDCYRRPRAAVTRRGTAPPVDAGNRARGLRRRRSWLCGGRARAGTHRGESAGWSASPPSWQPSVSQIGGAHQL